MNDDPAKGDSSQCDNRETPNDSLLQNHQDEEFYWYALSPEVAIAKAKVTGIRYKLGDDINLLIETIDGKINAIRNRMRLVTKRNGNVDNQGYSDERILYIRGLRDRTNKAESEALEKMIYKEKCEERQRWLDYHSRTKKKTPEQIELQEFLGRPFRMATSTRTNGIRPEKCPFGSSCELCNGWYATCILTDKELAAGGGDVLKAIKYISRKDIRKTIIPSRGFRKIDDEDIPDDSDTTDDEPMRKRVRLGTRGTRNTEISRLLELKYSLAFIRDFNSGPIHSRKCAR